MDKTAIPSDFTGKVNKIKETIGKTRLQDEEMVYLLADEIARSFTQDEKGVSGKRP